MSTRERKRHERAVPPPVAATHMGRSVAFMLLVCPLAALYFWKANSVLAGVVAALVGVTILGVALPRLYGFLLLVRARREWIPRGVRCIIVSSDSPVWRERIATQWPPQLAEQAVKLNWSERSRWKSTLAVRMFRHFVMGSTNYNPAVLVLRGLQQPAVYRFYYAFREAHHGRPEYLEELEASMLASMGIDGRGITIG